MERCLVFIDAGYLTSVANRLFKGKPPKYDIKRFSIGLAKEQGLWCEKIFYYCAPPYQSRVSTKVENERRSGYDSFIHELRKRGDIVIREGRCQRTKDGFCQKGVDTLMTMDLLEMPAEKKIKRIIVITGDTDFVPVLNRIRSRNSVYVILYYFADRVRDSKFAMSNHLLAVCNKKVAISAKHFEECAID